MAAVSTVSPANASSQLPKVYENPKITAVAVGHLTGEDFYNCLEKAIQRSNGKLVEAHAIRTEEN
jgi:hypothetical protein